MSRPALVTDADHVTPEWLTHVLSSAGVLDSGKVTSFDSQFIGTGQIGANVRFRLTYEGDASGPASLVCKFASRDQVSRQAGVNTHTYETEVNFYRDLADSVEIRKPRCYFCDIVPGTAEVCLVLEDLAPAVQGDQVAGCTVGHARLAMVEAARLHGPRWGDPTLRDVSWLSGRSGIGGVANMLPNLWPGFVGRYGDRLVQQARDTGERMAPKLPGYAAASPTPRTIAHGDYRIDNMLFGTAEGGYPLAVVDWQTVGLNSGTSDVSYFLGAGLVPDDRRAHERDLVALYHDTLMSYGVADYPFEACWTDYRRFAFDGFLMAVIASALVGRTDRGDDMFMAMANRAAIHAADVDSEGLLG